MSNPASIGLPPERSTSFILSAISGFVDTAGFILLSGIFTAHVTGNLVLAGAAIAGHHNGGVFVRLLLFPVFMLAVVGASWLARYSGACVVRRVLLAEALAMAGFIAIGVCLDHPRHHFPDHELFMIGSVAVIAMGIQNALMREGLKTFLPTTMMTGNTTQFTLDLAQWIRDPAKARSNGVSERLHRFGNVLVGFVFGAALGAAGAATIRFWCPCLPFVALLILAVKSPKLETTTES